jgi:hypothetical protein
LENDEELPAGVLARVRHNEDDAMVPDLAALEDSLREVMAQAA